MRALPDHQTTVFLSFDDGPDPEVTPRVLDILRAYRAQATFFVVGNRASAQPELLSRVVTEGHAVGNHSLDHQYRHFFTRAAALRRWIERGEQCLETLGVAATANVGFRPPAGILTPPLLRAVTAMNCPLVLWNERFYDTLWPWTEARALRSARRLRGGSIVLLHDRVRHPLHGPNHNHTRDHGRALRLFTHTLEIYLQALRARGFGFAPLTRELCQKASGHTSAAANRLCKCRTNKNKWKR